MKKYFSIILIVLALYGCDESFSPKGDYQERFALFAIMRADTNLQVVTLYHSYDVKGLDPFENKEDPFISNAFVRIWKNKDDVYILKDSSIERRIEQRYSSAAKYYYTDSLIPEKNDKLEIEALLPNGRRLKAETQIPYIVDTDYSLTDGTIPVKGRNNIIVAWRPREENIIYAPQLTIIYKKVENGVATLHHKIIPQKYLIVDGKEIAIYPQPSNKTYVEYEKEALDRAFAEISEGDPNKSSYRILTLITKILIYDRNLSAYYSSSNKFGDDYSVRVDESDFSNVEGGFGVFGSYSVKKIVQFFDLDYIKSFGYILEIKP